MRSSASFTAQWDLSDKLNIILGPQIPVALILVRDNIKQKNLNGEKNKTLTNYNNIILNYIIFYIYLGRKINQGLYPLL